nr:nuclear transport factor 2 family protein [Pseudomonas lalucatii]
MTLISEIQAAENSLAEALASGDVHKFTALYTEDAQLTPNQAPTFSGRDEIAAFFESTLQQGIVAGSFQTLEVEGFGETAVEIGNYVLFAELAPGQRVEAGRGKYMVLWKRIGGRWLMHRDLFNNAATPG